MNNSFSIKFIIFDNTILTKKKNEIRKNIILTKKQNEIKKKLCNVKVKNNDLKKILKEVCSELNDIIKFLDRVEPSICSLDEKKQLRTWSFIDDDSDSIIFNQNHSMCKEYFTIEELTIISQKIKEKIESYLQCKIAEPIIYNASEDNKEDNQKSNLLWERKPHPNWGDDPIEDLFLCHNCNGWWPYYKYDNGKEVALNKCAWAWNTEGRTYSFMNDDKDRGGRRWACNYCVDKILYDNNIITVTDVNGKIITNYYDECHPMFRK